MTEPAPPRRGQHQARPGSGAVTGSRLGPRPLAFYLGLARLCSAGPADPPAAPAGASGGKAPDPTAAFLAGVRAYWRHPGRPPAEERPVLWRKGAARLLDYGEGEHADARSILVLPSLVNRAHILDLLPERSLLRHLAGLGYRPLLLDWGRPEGAELGLTIADHLFDRAAAALEAAASACGGQAPVLLGYCMGGTLALALAQARECQLAALALLATPWDFHAGPTPAPLLTAAGLLPWTLAIAALGYAPVELLQTHFALLDPAGVVRKFAAFAELAPDGPEARLFVAIEDWLNDGIPLAGPVAQECLWHWYVENRPAHGTWAPGGTPVDPGRLRLPTFVAVPRHDRIVPEASAEALLARLPHAEVLRPAAGHVGMVVGAHAPRQLWQPLDAWLRRIAPRRAVPPVRPAWPT